MLFLDTRPLHAVLMQNVVMLEQKVRNDPLSERMPRRAEQLNLLTKLAAQVDPEFRPVAAARRAHQRVGSVDAIVGFTKISGFLRDDEMDPLVDGTKRRAEVSATRSSSRPSDACATRMRARWSRHAVCSRPMRRLAVRGRSATCRRPATGWSRR